MTLLKLKNIYKSFGESHVLNGLDISFDKGKIYTIIGGNGAGKTTLFNLITGFLKPDKGEIIFNDKNILSKTPVQINQLGITRTFQDLRLINELSVKENILLAFKNNPNEKIFNSMLPSRFFKKENSEFIKRTFQILEKIHLLHVADNLAGEISYGQQKLLTIGCCMANDAQLLLLDEPIAGIDKENYKRIHNLLVELKDEGKTILQIEHNHRFVEDLSDGIWFLNGGVARYFEDFKCFNNDPKVKDVYLN